MEGCRFIKASIKIVPPGKQIIASHFTQLDQKSKKKKRFTEFDYLTNQSRSSRLQIHKEN